jgi:hypothetical protein
MRFGNSGKGVLLAAAGLIVAGGIATALVVASPASSPTISETDDAVQTVARVDADCGEPTVTVSTKKQLTTALDDAAPGDVIALEAGTYSGRFIAEADGTADEPITLCGPEDAVLDGGGTRKGYVLHLDGVDHWVLSGFSVRNGQKGVMADATTNTLFSGLHVSRTGDEAIHLRDFSTDNRVVGNTIRDTGQRKAKFGEGIYVGTAESNWCDVSDCEPDASDRNLVEGNDIADTTSESIDLKEGTADGIVRGNTFDGSAITGADSWVDVKGNDWLIEGNTGASSPQDGFQTHEILDGWGTGNVFRDNEAAVDGPGFGYSLTPELDNIVECSNSATGAAEGTTNVECRD